MEIMKSWPILVPSALPEERLHERLTVWSGWLLGSGGRG